MRWRTSEFQFESFLEIVVDGCETSQVGVVSKFLSISKHDVVQLQTMRDGLGGKTYLGILSLHVVSDDLQHCSGKETHTGLRQGTVKVVQQTQSSLWNGQDGPEAEEEFAKLKGQLYS